MDRKYKKILLRGIKIALGSSFAIFLAHFLHLNHDISAGTITLLTIVSTKWETVKLSVYRVLTMLFTIGMTWLFFLHISNQWVAYGCFIFLLVVVCELLGWGATISVNAVIAAHFLANLDFSARTVGNEIALVVIGITVAIVLNLFHDNGNFRKELVWHMRCVEWQMQAILGEIAAYLSRPDAAEDAWNELEELEGQIRQYVVDACDYQNNTFASHPGYYIDYFEMRLQQCSVLLNLHYEMQKLRNIPEQAKIAADYILYMKEYIKEVNSPEEQIARLKHIIAGMADSPVPGNWKEFSGKAILYHVLIDMEDFLYYNKRFVDGLDERQRRIYWKEEQSQDKGGKKKA